MTQIIEKYVYNKCTVLLMGCRVVERDIVMANKKVCDIQCDQIGRYFGLWATFYSLWQ